MKRIFSIQAPRSVVMIRPHHFGPNPDTAADNSFQSNDNSRQAETIAKAAYDEVSQMAERLMDAGVGVHMLEDNSAETPDSVFPNNWFSTHAGGHVAVYPMYAPNRQKERRWDIIEMLKSTYRVQDVIDYSGLEYDQVYLEGTGAMVLDHVERVAYAARSNRTDPVALERFCTHFNFEPLVFDAFDAQGKAIYHTNVLMCIGTNYALVGLDCIANEKRRDEVRGRLESGGRETIALSAAQIADFAGNAIELEGKNGRVLAMSSRALRSLTLAQISLIERSAQILPLDVPTIELAGGSVRCMLAGVHLSAR